MTSKKHHIDTAQKAYFNDRALPNDDPIRYVGWLDLMGTRQKSEHAPRTVAICIGKLHDAIVRGRLAAGPDVEPVAMGDGAYLVATKWAALSKALGQAMRLMSLAFIHEVESNSHRYAPLCRAGVARGRVIRGTDLLKGWERGAAPLDPLYQTVAAGVMLGATAAHANEMEAHAAPFGVAIDRSAHDLYNGAADRVPDGRWWRWWDPRVDSAVIDRLGSAIAAYYDWFDKNDIAWEYPEPARGKHLRACEQYYGIKIARSS